MAGDFLVSGRARRQAQASLTPKPGFLPPHPLACLCSGFHMFHLYNSSLRAPAPGMGHSMGVGIKEYIWEQRIEGWMRKRDREVREAGGWPSVSVQRAHIASRLSSGFRLLPPGRGECLQITGHVTHFSVTWRI